MSWSAERASRDRACPRCGTRVAPEQLRAEHGVTWLWRCTCGWSGAVTESGVVARGGVRAALEALENEAGESDDEPDDG